MTQPTTPAGPYQMPSAAPVAAPQGRSVSPAGYWIGGGILVVGCGIAIVWFIVTIVGLVDAPNDFDRIAIPGTEVVTLDDGDWTIYYETEAGRFSTYNPPSVNVAGPDGRDISVGYPSTAYTYDISGTQGEALYEFRAPTAGAYTIEASTVGEPGLRSGDQIAIGRALFDGSQIGGVLGSLALGAIAFLIGLVVLIVTIVRRGRAKRRPAMAYGGGPYGGAPYGGAPYAGQQYGAAPGYPPTPGSWPPPQAPGWGAPPGGPPPPPGGPASWPPPTTSSPESSPWGTPAAPPAPSADPPPPAAPSPWTPPGTPGGSGSSEPDDDTAPG